MKLIYLLVAIVSFSQFSNAEEAKVEKSIEGRISRMECVEVNPFVIGDACIIFLEGNNSKLALVYNSQKLSYEYGETAVIGQLLEAKQCSTIKISEEIKELKDYDSDYFYLRCEHNGFNLVADSSHVADMYRIAEKNRGSSYHSGSLANRYSDKYIKRDDYPKFSEELKNSLSKLEENSLKEWKNFVDQSDEYDHLSQEKREELKNDPNSYFQTNFLNEIESVYAIYKKSTLIGYAFELNRYVRGQIIQDGSGLVIYTDSNLKPLVTNEWDS